MTDNDSKTNEKYFQQSYEELLAYSNNLFHAILDDSEAVSGKKILYSIDFNVIYPYMWQHHNIYNKNLTIQRKYYDFIGRTIFLL